MLFQKFWPTFVVVIGSALLITYMTYDDEKMLKKFSKYDTKTQSQNVGQN